MSFLAQMDWSASLNNWAYAHGEPTARGCIKITPEDFHVSEYMQVEPTGEGEHVWLHISKTRQNTEQVAKALARHANIAYRDVGYSGLKDFFATTEQWFSVWLPGTTDPDWAAFDLQGVSIKQVCRHTRKIRRGTHKSNRFAIRVRQFAGDFDHLEDKVKQITRYGVPNYFGSQRFGRDASNLPQAVALLVDGQKINNRNLRGIVISSARSWLFNCVVSERLRQNTWNILYDNEPANLDGSGSIFNSQGSDEQTRLASLDIHPTAPMWGERKQGLTEDYVDLHQFELAVLAPYQALCRGLESSGTAYQRRPVRMVVNDLVMTKSKDSIELNFELQRGQFATSVLRELVCL